MSASNIASRFGAAHGHGGHGGHGGHAGSTKMWANLTYTLWVIPAAYTAYCFMTEEHVHRTVKLPYMDIDRKPFPWGDGKTSLFTYWTGIDNTKIPEHGHGHKHH